MPTWTGQTCASVEIALVHRAVYETFVDGVVNIVRGLRVGNPLDPNTDVGPLSNERQLQIVEEHVQDALAKGARALVGGHRLDRPGYFFAPTVLVDVTPDMRIVQEETFGPVLAILPVSSIEEAIAFVNAMLFGLTACTNLSTSSSSPRSIAKKQSKPGGIPTTRMCPR